jgi:hypothetical protein
MYYNNPMFIPLEFYCRVVKHFDDYQMKIVHNHLGVPVYYDHNHLERTICAYLRSPWYPGTDEVIMKYNEHFGYYKPRQEVAKEFEQETK